MGICIEPSPPRFKLLKNNRACICENYAISDTAGKVDFLDISGWGKGLSGIVDNYHPLHEARVRREINHPNNTGYKTVTVRTELIGNILDKHGIYHINLCSIDVEGSEYDIIKTIDFNRFKIDVLLIENNYNDNKIINFMIDNGYILENTLTIDNVFLKI